MVSSLLLLLSGAFAQCPEPGPILGDAERDTLSLFLADAQQGLVAASEGFACTPADRLVLARYWLIQGMIWYVQENPSADRALAAARRDAPTRFVEAFGEELKERWASTDPAGGPPVPLRIRGARKTDRLRIDGISTEDRAAPLGLHVVQLERDGAILGGRVVDVAGEGVEIAFGEDVEGSGEGGATLTGWQAPWPGPPTWNALGVRDASGERLRFARDVIPVAMVSPQGPELWRVRRRNTRLQRIAAATGVLGGYATYLFAWEAQNGENLRPGVADQGALLGLVTLTGALTWEGVLVAKRRSNRRGMLEAAATVGSPP